MRCPPKGDTCTITNIFWELFKVKRMILYWLYWAVQRPPTSSLSSIVTCFTHCPLFPMDAVIKDGIFSWPAFWILGSGKPVFWMTIRFSIKIYLIIIPMRIVYQKWFEFDVIVGSTGTSIQSIYLRLVDVPNLLCLSTSQIRTKTKNHQNWHRVGTNQPTIIAQL